MSAAPANRKNLPAAHTPVTTGFRCEYCNGLFGKRYLLRTHQQKLHGLPKTTAEDERPARPLPSLPAPSITTLALPAIETAAMVVAKARGEIPFAVLHIANEIPLIVRILEQGNVSLLKAAENSDFRESQRGCPVGTSVSIAVVASIYQKFTDDGQMYFEIRGPVSRYQATMPEVGGVGGGGGVLDALYDPEAIPEGVLQESLDGGDMYKTLTQINTVLEGTSNEKPKAPNCTSLAKSSSSSALKRKNLSSRNGPAALKPNTAQFRQQQPMTSTPKKPKVIALLNDSSSNWNRNQNVSPNREAIGAGPLLSPIRPQAIPAPAEVQPTVEDPLADLDLQDLIQVDDDGLLPGAVMGGFL